MPHKASEAFDAAREMPADRREGSLLGAVGETAALRAEVGGLLEADAANVAVGNTATAEGTGKRRSSSSKGDGPRDPHVLAPGLVPKH